MADNMLTFVEYGSVNNCVLTGDIIKGFVCYREDGKGEGYKVFLSNGETVKIRGGQYAYNKLTNAMRYNLQKGGNK